MLKKIRTIFKKGDEQANPRSFKNELYESLDVNYENFFTHESTKIDVSNPLKEQIKRISFELSNLCNYASIHERCPASKVKDKKILSTGIVHKVIDEMAEIGYQGVFAFHRYNEPLIDNRLFDFIKYAKSKCPKSKILILSNGYLLTQEVADKFKELAIWVLAVSAYSEPEFDRLTKLDVKVPYFVFYSILDDIYTIYDENARGLNLECGAPLRDFNVNVFGQVPLCCLDWKNKYIFGNLENETIGDIVRKESFRDVLDGLLRKKRNLDICKGCKGSR